MSASSSFNLIVSLLKFPTPSPAENWVMCCRWAFLRQLTALLESLFLAVLFHALKFTNPPPKFRVSDEKQNISKLTPLLCSKSIIIMGFIIDRCVGCFSHGYDDDINLVLTILFITIFPLHPLCWLQSCFPCLWEWRLGLEQAVSNMPLTEQSEKRLCPYSSFLLA